VTLREALAVEQDAAADRVAELLGHHVGPAGFRLSARRPAKQRTGGGGGQADAGHDLESPARTILTKTYNFISYGFILV
jgi:hypothetical protein